MNRKKHMLLPAPKMTARPCTKTPHNRLGQHHANRKEQALHPASRIAARSKFGPCATRLSPRAAKTPAELTSHEDSPQPPRLAKSPCSLVVHRGAAYFFGNGASGCLPFFSNIVLLLRAAICVLGFVGPFLKPPALEAMKRDLDEIKARLHYPGALRGLRIKASGI